jgi:hypothetical protein
MRVNALMALVLVGVAPLAAQADPDNKVAGGGTLPAGWSARLDDPTKNMADVKFVAMGPGWHVTLGPHAIFWREADKADGSYHAIASFTQTKAPTHPEAYGLIIGGNDLKGDNQTYTYLIVRQDGMFSIRQRNGAAVTNVTQGNRAGWAANEALVKADSAGKAKNTLEIESDAKANKTTFKINGKTVHETASASPGIVGIRVGHNLDVHIDGFAVHKL